MAAAQGGALALCGAADFKPVYIFPGIEIFLIVNSIFFVDPARGRLAIEGQKVLLVKTSISAIFDDTGDFFEPVSGFRQAQRQGSSPAIQ